MIEETLRVLIEAGATHASAACAAELLDRGESAQVAARVIVVAESNETASSAVVGEGS